MKVTTDVRRLCAQVNGHRKNALRTRKKNYGTKKIARTYTPTTAVYMRKQVETRGVKIMYLQGTSNMSKVSAAYQ